WIVANTSNCTPNINNLGANQFLDIIDNISSLYPGNFVIRAFGDTAFYPTATPTQTDTPTSTPTPLPPRCPGERFTDVCPGDYFYTPVLSLNSAGVVSGY